MSHDLVAYLRAREDEREAVERRKWRVRSDARIDYTLRREMGHEWIEVTEVVVPQTLTREILPDDFHAEFCEPDPDPWVLADIESKRAILDRLELVRTEDTAGWNEYSEWILGRRGPELVRTTDTNERVGLEMAVRLMAQPYAGRDDFQDEWRVP